MILPSGLPVEMQVSLKPFTSWLVGGAAEYLTQPRTLIDLKQSLAWASLMGVSVTVVSGGTNILVSDSGVKGLTVCLRKFAGLTVSETPLGSDDSSDGTLRFECLAGTSKSELLKNFLKHRQEPALFLAGIPGDVGGGVVMNAGIGELVTPREFTEITEWIEVLRVSSREPGNPSPENILALADEFEVHRIPAEELTWSYRHCEGWRPGIIVRVGLAWRSTAADDILTRVKNANQIRLSKQPLDQPSCGSVFRNPDGTTSGRVIDNAGLKGFQIGGAKVSEKHANFIVNTGAASALDIHQVISHVQQSVLERTGLRLLTEVVYVGEWGDFASGPTTKV